MSIKSNTVGRLLQYCKFVATLLATSGAVLAEEEWAGSTNQLWFYNMPNWLIAVLLTVSSIAVFWLIFRIISRWLPSGGKNTNRCLVCYATVAGAILGALLTPFITGLKEDSLLSQINSMPPSAAGVTATTYYVDPAGSDGNPGTAASPFQTIQAAASRVNPGDVVIVRNGTYTTDGEVLGYITRSGVSGAPITFRAENPNGAILSGNNNKTTYGWFIGPNVGYVIIQDFDLTGFSKVGFHIENSDNIQIIGNHAYEIGRKCSDDTVGNTGMYVTSSTNIIARNNMFRNIGRYAPGENGCQPTNAYYKNHDHGIYIDGVNGMTIQANTFYNLARGWGIQIYSGSNKTASNIKIQSNIFSQPNPFMDGHIIVASPISSTSVTGNQFYQPKNQAIYFYTTTNISNMTINTNTTYNAVISSSVPKSGVSLSSNTKVQ
jgi:hypothetical protein